jgi:hypothetical protein
MDRGVTVDVLARFFKYGEFATFKTDVMAVIVQQHVGQTQALPV